MKKWMLFFAALAALSGNVLFGQDLTGTWQGTLSVPGRDLRTVFKISRVDDALKGVMYSIDQGAGSIPVSKVTLQGSTVKMSVMAIAGEFEGKLSADGNSISGNWTQGPKPLPLNLTRANESTAWAIPEPPPKLKPMAADANPQFEVATIKPSKPGAPGKALMVRGLHFSTLNTTVADLISFAYGVHARQVIDGPPWLESDKYDLSAEPDGEGQPSLNQWKVMMQKLLADRLQLKFHRDKKELSVYAIVIGNNGPKIAKSEGDPNGLPSLMFRGLGVLPATNATMVDFAGVMQAAVLDRPVVDQTGLQGRYDFLLKWTPDEFQFGGLGVRPPAATDNPDAPPDLFTAMQEQLGLKLKATKAEAEVLVIEHVEKPSAN